MGAKVISFVDCNDNIILREKVTSLPLKEECIINRSITLFNDSEPCIIHRTFVMKKMFLEIDDFLNGMIAEGKKEIPADCLPSELIKVIEIEKQPSKIVIDA